MYLFLLETIMCSALERLLFPYTFSALGILSRVLSDDDWDVAWTWLGHHAVKVYIRVGVSWLAPFLLFVVVPLLLPYCKRVSAEEAAINHARPSTTPKKKARTTAGARKRAVKKTPG